MSEQCAICGAPEGGDLRTLNLRFFYDLTEVSAKLQRVAGGPNEPPMYQVSTCKQCRGEFLGLLREWLNGNYRKEESEDACIPYRKDGAMVMLTQAEWESEERGRR